MSQGPTNPLSPAGKDPSEGPRGSATGGAPGGPLDESHLGHGGDPVEGRDDPAAAGEGPAED